MRDQDNERQADHRVNRVLMISPNQTETLRRNRSRIFIFPAGEGMIDSLIFQNSRPIESFEDIVFDAIKASGLNFNSDDQTLTAIHRPDYAGGMLTSFFETNGWLVGKDDELFDLAIEVSIYNETIQQPDVRTFNGSTLDNGDRPLCIVIDVDQFQRTSSFMPAAPRSEEVQADDNGQQEMQRAAARQPQEGENQGGNNGSDNDGRKQGQPGRVRDPLLDGRMKHNRRKPQEGEGNSPRAAGGGNK